MSVRVPMSEPCPKHEVKAKPCPKSQRQDSPIKVEAESPPKMDNRQISAYTISDDDLINLHASNLLNTSMVSSLGDEANEYEEHLVQPLVRRVQQTIKTCLTHSKVWRSQQGPM